MTIAASLVAELERESKATAGLLARVPTDKLDWKPHAKSMTLGELAWHVAAIPQRISQLLEAGTFDMSTARPKMNVESTDFAAQMQRGVEEAKRVVGALDDAAIMQPFNFMKDGVFVRSLPKLAAVRSIMLNHSYHHRGQLTVYLRMLDVPLPAIYGTSADEAM
jgi:uncharacterized damage-inducible protein DinB